MAWIMSEIVILWYPNRAMTLRKDSIEVHSRDIRTTDGNCHKFWLTLLVVLSYFLTHIFVVWLVTPKIQKLRKMTLWNTSKIEKSEACLAAQQISLFLCKPKIQYDVYKNMQLVHYPLLLTFWWRIFFQILAHPVFKVCVIQKPNKVALWNKRHFEEKKNGD